MRTRYSHRLLALSVVGLTLLSASCGDGSSPTSPSGETSFLNGPWNGTLTISRTGQPDITGPTTWTFEVIPGTGRQTFRTTIRSQNSWVPVTTTSTIGLVPSADPPGQIGGTGHFDSPRGCLGDFVTTGTASATAIEATFDGIDCDNGTGIRQPFSGRVRLSK
jgi:hypothetical protein